MDKKSCSEKLCRRCGWCCTNLGKEIDLTEQEEEKLKRLVFERSGVIYLRTIRKFYLSMSKEEADALRRCASKLGISVDILPNKLIYDPAKNKVLVYDFYLNHDSCPFFKDNSCLVYSDRPSACRQYPKTNRSYMKEVAKFIKRSRIDQSSLFYDEAVQKCRACIQIKKE